MILQINLPGVHSKLLSGWASVSRTLTEAARLLEKAANTVSETNETRAFIEQMDYTRSELDALTIPLDSLHQLWRSAVWAQSRGGRSEVIMVNQVMQRLTDEQRLEVLRTWCPGCGSELPCTCVKDD